MKRDELLKKFQAKARTLVAAKRKARFRYVVGKLKRAKLLDAPGIPEYGGPIEIEDVLWAGTFEPRILEVLPALITTRPKYLRIYQMPEDLRQVLDGIRIGNICLPFRGISPKEYSKWLPREGRGSARLKTFRMHQDEIQQLKRLRIALGLRSDAEVLRQALYRLQQSITNG